MPGVSWRPALQQAPGKTLERTLCLRQQETVAGAAHSDGGSDGYTGRVVCGCCLGSEDTVTHTIMRRLVQSWLRHPLQSADRSAKAPDKMTQEVVHSEEENHRAGTGMTTQLRPRPLTPDPQPLPLKTLD